MKQEESLQGWSAYVIFRLFTAFLLRDALESTDKASETSAKRAGLGTGKWRKRANSQLSQTSRFALAFSFLAIVPARLTID